LFFCFYGIIGIFFQSLVAGFVGTLIVKRVRVRRRKMQIRAIKEQNKLRQEEITRTVSQRTLPTNISDIVNGVTTPSQTPTISTNS
jgi:predicted dinucleotide-utilizing enzyme